MWVQTLHFVFLLYGFLEKGSDRDMSGGLWYFMYSGAHRSAILSGLYVTLAQNIVESLVPLASPGWVTASADGYVSVDCIVFGPIPEGDTYVGRVIGSIDVLCHVTGCIGCGCLPFCNC